LPATLFLPFTSTTISLEYHDLILIEIHALVSHKPGHLHFPECIVITPASENDLNVHEQNWFEIPDRSFLVKRFKMILNYRRILNRRLI
jgi:hypothetical protein